MSAATTTGVVGLLVALTGVAAGASSTTATARALYALGGVSVGLGTATADDLFVLTPPRPWSRLELAVTSGSALAAAVIPGTPEIGAAGTLTVSVAAGDVGELVASVGA